MALVNKYTFWGLFSSCKYDSQLPNRPYLSCTRPHPPPPPLEINELIELIELLKLSELIQLIQLIHLFPKGRWN